MKKLHICLVEDEEILRESLKDDLFDFGYVVYDFENPLTALEYCTNNDCDIIISDIRLPGMSGIDLLAQVKKVKPEIFVIIMTAFGSVQTAVDAMRKGAYDYITKPFKTEELILLLERIQQFTTIRNDNITITSQLQSKYSVASGVIRSNKMKEVFKLLELVSKSSTSILISGETGTGKEFLTNVIHYRSNRSEKPLIKVSCAILAKEVFESELFGHDKGAFTGAMKEKKGRFEIADGGTLYLDDIDDIPIELQVKLLRVLEESEFERVGGSETIKVDVRVIASTKVDLKKMVAQGRFREDLFYRLNVFPIQLHPLRERIEDIPVLIDYYMSKYSNGRIICSPEVIEVLQKYNWPGNVRELKNLMERMSLICQNGSVTIDSLPLEILTSLHSGEQSHLGSVSLDKIMADYEKELLKIALLKFSGNKAKASEFLQIPASTLRSKLDKYNIEK
ncbi:MAG: sigma-54-dependent Fis family transcriptional regulator [Ignavibacteriales bacterium]|nr:sigma-54-dependent Fis family transcriptional regulator [Ignavibacteriales bacterium]